MAEYGIQDNRFKIALYAVPEDGKANKELIKVLAERLMLPRKTIELVSGISAPVKRLKVTFTPQVKKFLEEMDK